MLALAVQGGAWDIPDDLVDLHRDGVHRAMQAGWKVLEGGGTAVEAVETAVMIMEDDETFDAGRGSFINQSGEVELDASIMNGATLRAGAVAAVKHVRNPIALARKVMEESDHVLLVGMGATRFAREHGVKTCKQDDLITLRELDRWREVQADKRFRTKDAFRRRRVAADTVGAVALDARGNIASGTSTGGTPNKYPGRVGDSPLIGCGTYADNTVGGVSTSGWGEAMITVVMAKSVVDLIERLEGDPQAAAEQGLRMLARRVDGYGGVVAVTPHGRIGVSYNTPRMARAFMSSSMEKPVVGV